MAKLHDIPTIPNHAPVRDEGIIEEHMRKLFGRSWKTTFAGLLTFACGVAPFIPGMPKVLLDICGVALPIVIGGGLITAKDKGVSGVHR